MISNNAYKTLGKLISWLQPETIIDTGIPTTLFPDVWTWYSREWLWHCIKTAVWNNIQLSDWVLQACCANHCASSL